MSMAPDVSGTTDPATPKADHCLHRRSNRGWRKVELELDGNAFIAELGKHVLDDRPKSRGDILGEDPTRRHQELFGRRTEGNQVVHVATCTLISRSVQLEVYLIQSADEPYDEVRAIGARFQAINAALGKSHLEQVRW